MIAVFRPRSVENGGAWSRTAVTRDGAHYRVRPIRPDDAQREREFLCTLSNQARYFRFLHAVGEPPAKLVDELVQVDGSYSMAFVAVVGAPDNETIVGVARYAADDSSGCCEFALAVADAWQDRGVGATLMGVLLEYARAAGMKRTFGTIHPDNARMVDLAHWLGMETRLDRADPRLLVASRSLD